MIKDPVRCSSPGTDEIPRGPSRRLMRRITLKQAPQMRFQFRDRINGPGSATLYQGSGFVSHMKVRPEEDRQIEGRRLQNGMNAPSEGSSDIGCPGRLVERRQNADLIHN